MVTVLPPSSCLQTKLGLRRELRLNGGVVGGALVVVTVTTDVVVATEVVVATDVVVDTTVVVTVVGADVWGGAGFVA
jgi:hypothetical protein